MDVLKKNTIPSFEIVPRKTLTISSIFNLELKNEMNQKKEVIFATISLLPNENYQITFDSFPSGKIGDKISYTLFQDNEVVLLGKILIASENQDIQDYSKKTNNKFYK
jgi:hypothetical protein